MLSRLRSALASLVFLKEEEARYTARFVAYLLPVCAAVMVLLIVFPLMAGDFTQRLGVGAPAILVYAASWWLLRRGKVRLASLTFIVASWVVATYALITRDGVRAPAYITYLVLTTYAAFLVSPAAALAVFLICLLAGSAVVVAAYTGSLPVPFAVHTPATLYASYSASMLMIILIVLVITAEYRDAFGKLRASEEKLRLWLAATRDPILVLGTDGRFTEGNEAAARAFGVSSPADLAGRVPADFSPEFQPDGVPSSVKAEQMIRAAFQERSAQFEWVHRRRDGSEFLADVALTVVPLQPANVLMAHLRDVTERHQAQEALARHVELEDLLLEACTRLINLDPSELDHEIDVLLRQAGEFAGADRSYVFQVHEDRATGSLTHEWCREGVRGQIGELQLVEVSGFPWLAGKLLHREVVLIPRVRDLPPEASAERAEFERTDVKSMLCVPLLLGDQVVGLVGFDSLTEQEAWTGETVALLRAAANAIAGALERKRSEEARREAEGLFRSAFDDAPDGMAITDREARFVQVNHALCRMLGCAETELLGRTVFDITLPEDLETSRGLMQRLRVAGQEALDLESRYVTRDGRVIWGALRASRLPAPAGRPPRYLIHVQDITVRKQAQDALRESEQRFRAIVESTGDWIWFADASGVHRYSNRAIHDLLGYAPEEIVGTSIFSFMHPDDVLRGRAAMERAIAERGGWSALVIRWRHKDGTYRYLESTGAPAFSPTGDLLGWYGADRDVTERREAEEALRESEGKYRALFEMLPVTVVIHQDRKVALANRASTTMFRVTGASSVIGEDIARYIAEEARAQMEARLRADKRGEPEAPDHYFTTLQRADGEEFPAEIFVTDVVYQGRPAAQAVVIDITEEVRMQQALRDSEARLRALFAAMSDVILVVSAEGRCLEVAPTKPESLYRPAEEILGKTVHEIFPAEQADYFLDHIRQALAAGHTTQIEYTVVIGGQERYFSAAISPLSPDTVIVVARDVTAVVEQRNRLLAAERARADLAEHLNEEINHRARNNLAMVSGLLQMQALEEPSVELAARLREAVARIRTFVDIHEKIYAAGAEEADLLDVIRRLATTLRTIFAAAAAEFSVTGASGLFPTRAVTNLAVVTNELLTNALKHGDAGAGGVIQVKVRIDRAGGRLRISVWNSGTPVPDGFDAAAQKGMGLRLVTGIAQQYGASFSVRPAEGGTVAELVVDEAALGS